MKVILPTTCLTSIWQRTTEVGSGAHLRAAILNRISAFSTRFCNLKNSTRRERSFVSIALNFMAFRIKKSTRHGWRPSRSWKKQVWCWAKTIRCRSSATLNSVQKRFVSTKKSKLFFGFRFGLSEFLRDFLEHLCFQFAVAWNGLPFVVEKNFFVLVQFDDGDLPVKG